ncbi:MAG: 50S ribosomal protein L22 [Leptospiraceae bacterium]|nr:50S ribosomal protein L22 [Leptospiraceae bacterium]MDW7975176.1 50S ribosomal protein L22 [Leptospiraceae bacterium]
MEAKAISNFLIISPRKLRLVANEVRGYYVDDALSILRNMPKKGARFLEKTILSAKANYLFLNQKADEKKIYIKKLYVDAGPILKRYRPRARGRAFRRLKRTSKITVVVAE